MLEEVCHWGRALGLALSLSLSLMAVSEDVNFPLCLLPQTCLPAAVLPTEPEAQINIFFYKLAWSRDVLSQQQRRNEDSHPHMCTQTHKHTHKYYLC